MREIEYQNPRKAYVAVSVDIDTAGQLRPTSFVWEDGRRFAIDRVLDVRRAASLRAGGIGVRYTCSVCGKSVYLFQEENRWFLNRSS